MGSFPPSDLNSLFQAWPRRLRRAVFVAALGLCSGFCFTVTVPAEAVWAGGGDATRLEERLRAATDFRVRMQAALELGKRRASSSRSALEAALRSDQSSAVRAAAAAALEHLGDPRALDALRRARDDGSDAVRNQVASAIRSLESNTSATYIVTLGTVQSDSTVRAGSVGKSLNRLARRRLSRLPGVKIESENAAGTSPNVLLEARISRLAERRDGGSLEVSAKVDFVLSKMPGREIKGRLTGAATVRGDAKAKSREIEQLQVEAVEAAADSALDNVERALRATVE